MSGHELVTVERRDAVAVVRVNRPEKLNALNRETIAALECAFAELRDEDAVRGVIVTGTGEKAFVAGADIAELARMDPLSGVEVSRQGQRVLLDIERFPKPVVAAVNGYALGGGCELALACHLRIAGENARFGLPEVSLGIIPGYGGTVRLARIVGLGRALAMILTGDTIDANEAHRIGLVNAVAPKAELLPRAEELLQRILKNGPVAVRLAIHAVHRALETSTEDALSFESHLFGLLASTTDMQEGMRAFLDKRTPAFQGR
ncbi:MAG: enoyl-CoA hydratase/isomerase family protein [Gemmatimonadetes bacterium]|nr:enoyl-CoA hydratase/isomerase family protein [Gemmatimonadota bacterium]